METFWKLCTISISLIAIPVLIRRINGRASQQTESGHIKTVSFDLPFDLITEIMLRLPVKSLIRFKLVSKTWYALIQNPGFVDKYHITGPVITSILLHSEYDNQFYRREEGVYKTINLDFGNLRDHNHFIVGICGGLVCVAFGLANRDYIIGNPAIRDFRRISESKLSKPVNPIVFHGFSSFSSEYKIVRVMYRHASSGKVEVKAEGYTVSTDVWVEFDIKMGHVDNSFHFFKEDWSSYANIPVVLNEIFYWQAANSMNHMCVVSFDISSGLFDHINLPVNIVTRYDDFCDRWKILEYEEKLSFTICCDDRRFELWVLDEHTSSWTWKLKIDSIPIITIPAENKEKIEVIQYTKSGKLLVRDLYCGTRMNILFYDLSSRETKVLSCSVDQIMDSYFYTESLRTVKRRNDIKGAD